MQKLGVFWKIQDICYKMGTEIFKIQKYFFICRCPLVPVGSARVHWWSSVTTHWSVLSGPSSGHHTTMTRMLGWCLAAALLQAATPAKFFRTKFSNCGEWGRVSAVTPTLTTYNFSSPAAGLFRI